VENKIILHGIFEYEYYDEEQETTISMYNCKMLKDFGELKKGEYYDKINIEYPIGEITTLHPYDWKNAYKHNPDTVIKRFKFTIIPE
jgi:hypothetical protein